jgi:hypothetical protein
MLVGWVSPLKTTCSWKPVGSDAVAASLPAIGVMTAATRLATNADRNARRVRDMRSSTVE